jgi:hypothetical protein
MLDQDSLGISSRYPCMCASMVQEMCLPVLYAPAHKKLDYSLVHDILAIS